MINDRPNRHQATDEKRKRELASGERLRVDPNAIRKGGKNSMTFELLEEEAREIDQNRRLIEITKVERTLIIGELLTKAHDKLAKRKYKNGDGIFCKWVSDRLKIPRTTAYRWRRVFDGFKEFDCSILKQRFNLGALYELARQGTSKKVRDEAFDLASGGQQVTNGVAREIVKKHHPELYHQHPQPEPDSESPEPITREVYLENITGIVRANFAKRVKMLSDQHLLYLSDRFDSIWESIRKEITAASADELRELLKGMEEAINDVNKLRNSDRFEIPEQKRRRPKVSSRKRHENYRSLYS